MKKLLITLLVSMVFLLISCGPTKESEENINKKNIDVIAEKTISTEIIDPVEITVWHQYSDQYEVWFEEVSRDFEKLNPNIKINLQYQPKDQYDAKVMAAIKAGNLPSMIHSAAANMSTYIDQNALVDMNSFIYHEEIGYENFDSEINPGLNQMYIPWNNKRYAMPLFLGGNILFYNKTMFDELGLNPPSTWSEIEAIANVVSKEIGKPGFGIQILVDGFLEILIQSGENIVNLENGTVCFDSEVTKKAISWYQDLIDKDVARLVGDDVHFTNPFANRDVGFYVALSGNYGYLAGSVGDKFEIGAAPLPQEGPNKFVSLSEPVFAIANTNPEEELASWMFLEYLLSPEINAKCATIFGALPASLIAMEEGIYQEFLEINPVARAVYNQSDAYGYMPTISGWYEVRTSLDKALEEIILDINDVDEALENAKIEAEKAI